MFSKKIAPTLINSLIHVHHFTRGVARACVYGRVYEFCVQFRVYFEMYFCVYFCMRAISHVTSRVLFVCLFCIRVARNEQYYRCYGSNPDHVDLFISDWSRRFCKKPIFWEKRFLGFSDPNNSTAHSVPLQTQNKQFIEFNISRYIEKHKYNNTDGN